MARCGIITVESTPLSVTDYKAVGESIQRTLSLAKERLSEIPSSREHICISSLTVNGLSEGFLLLEEDGYTPSLILASAKSNHDMRLWGRGFLEINEEIVYLMTGCAYRVFGANIYMDYTLPVGVTIICSNIFEREQVSQWEFSKVTIC